MPDEKKSGDSKKTIAIVALLLLVGALVLFYFTREAHHIVSRTIEYVVANLAARSGLSIYLVEGIVVIATIPFFWAAAKFTHGKFLYWFHGIKPSLELYRSPYGILIVAYVGLFFLAMFYVSKDALAYKYCADTPEGIRTFDGPTKDPVYGIEARPCTYGQIAIIREGKNPGIGPQSIAIEDPSTYPFFDKITGDPRVWYFRSSDGTYQFFDRSGKFPGTGGTLSPITNEVREDVIRQWKRLEVEKHNLNAAQKQAEINKVKAEEARQKEEFVAKYINSNVSKHSGERLVALLILSDSADARNVIENALAADLSSHGFRPVEGFFKPPFAAEGRGKALLDGDGSQVSQLGLGGRVDSIVGAEVAATTTPSAQFEGMATANLVVALKCLRAADQSVCGQQHISSSGAGYSTSEAIQNAALRLKPQIEAFVISIR